MSDPKKKNSTAAAEAVEAKPAAEAVESAQTDGPAAEGAGGDESKVVELNAGDEEGAGDDEEGVELPEPVMYELGEPDMVKPIYALGVPGQPFIEKVQGIQFAFGVLVRWNNAAHFFPGARLEEHDEDSYTLRGA